LTEDRSTTLSQILQEAVKAEEGLNMDLRRIIREAILDRIEKGQGSFTDKALDMAFELPAAIFRESEAAHLLAKGALDPKYKEKEELTSIYNDVNFVIDYMSGRQLYWVLENLKGERPLDRVLKVILKDEALKYEHLRYKVIPTEEAARYEAVLSEYEVVLAKEKPKPSSKKSDKQGDEAENSKKPLT